MNYSGLASSFINFNKSSFPPCPQQCCQLGCDEVSPLFLEAFFIWSTFTYLRALVITKGLAAEVLTWGRSTGSRRDNRTPHLSGDYKLCLSTGKVALLLQKQTQLLHADPQSSVTLQADGLDTTAAEGHFPSFTWTLSWHCSYISNVSTEERHTVMFMNQSHLGSTSVDQPSM